MFGVKQNNLSRKMHVIVSVFFSLRAFTFSIKWYVYFLNAFDTKIIKNVQKEICWENYAIKYEWKLVY